MRLDAALPKISQPTLFLSLRIKKMLAFAANFSGTYQKLLLFCMLTIVHGGKHNKVFERHGLWKSQLNNDMIRLDPTEEAER